MSSEEAHSNPPNPYEQNAPQIQQSNASIPQPSQYSKHQTAINPKDEASYNFSNSSPRMDVFQRLYKLALDKNKPPPQPEVKKPTGPRHKIQDDLLQRGLQSKAKLRLKRTQKSAKELNSLSSKPNIDSVSRVMAKATKNKQTIQVQIKKYTKQVAQSIRKPKKQGTLINRQVKFPTLAPKNEESDITVDLTKMQMSFSQKLLERKKAQERKTGGAEAKTPTGYSYSYIQKLMDLSEEVTQEQQDPRPVGKGVVERVNYWQRQKQKKLKLKRQEKQDSELLECTFSPTLQSSMYQSPTSNSIRESMAQYSSEYREQGTSPTYNCLSPSARRVSYSSGMNLRAFIDKAQPMVEYRTIAAPHNQLKLEKIGVKA